MKRSDRPPTARLIARWTLVLLGLSVAWRTARFALSFPIWGDEAFVAVSILTRDFGGMLEPLAHFQIVPVVFMWVELAVARVLGASPGALRLVPVAAGLASLFVFWRLAPRLLGRRAGFLAIALFAASYYPVRHANEIKPYSFDLLAGLLITAAAWAVWRRPERRTPWLVLGAVGAAAIWCSYPSVFVSGGVLAALAVRVWQRRSVPLTVAWLACGAALAGSFLAMYVLVAKGQADAGASLFAAGSGWRDAFPPVREPWRLPAWFIKTHTGHLLAYPVGGRNGGSTATFVLAVAGAVSTWRRRRPVALLLLGPFALTLVAALMERYPYGGSARVAQHLAPMICLLAGAGLVAVARLIGGRRGVAHAIAIAPWVMSVIIAVGIARDVRSPYKGLDDANCRNAMAWLRDARAADDRRVVSGTFGASGSGPDMRAWGGRAARIRYELLGDRPGSIQWAPPPHDLPQDGVVWLIVYFNAGALEGDRERLESYVTAATERLGTADVTRFEIDVDYEEWVEFHRFDLGPEG